MIYCDMCHKDTSNEDSLCFYDESRYAYRVLCLDCVNQIIKAAERRGMIKNTNKKENLYDNQHL